MDWEQLICPDRYGKKPESGQDDRNPYQRDLDRVIYSQAFRRMQDKTQVHALTRNDHVRTRLTHSIEVASAGRSLGNRVGAYLQEKHPAITPEIVSSIVQATCLTHDIGNPPFGHLGEKAIRRHFREREGLYRDSSMTDAEWGDLTGFEGNAQGFRLLSRIEMYRHAGGMRLTAGTLGAFAKYPRGSLLSPDMHGQKLDKCDKTFSKMGYFQAEKDIFAGIAEKTGLTVLDKKAGVYVRHPLAYLMEAADDICYGVNDIEDGYAMGIISFKELEETLMPLIDDSKNYGDLAVERDKLGYLRAKAIGTLIYETADAFIAKEKDVLAGQIKLPLTEMISRASALEAAKDFAFNRIFRSRDVAIAEIAGFDVLDNLLSAFCSAILAFEKKTMTMRDENLLLILGDENLHLCRSRYERFLAVTDYIAGMTDRYAVSLSQRITGSSVSGTL